MALSSTDQTKPLRCVLVIDLGSGGPKAGVVAEDGRVLASAAVHVPTIILPDGGAEQDPQAWWDGAIAAARRAVIESAVPQDRIIAVCCDSQFGVIVPIDEHGGILMNAIHWLDRRGGPYNRAVVSGFPSLQGYGLNKLITWIRHTGLAPTRSGVDSLGHILYIKHERPDLYRKTRVFLEPMDYLIFRLTGKVAASQHTMLPSAVVATRTWGTVEYCDPLIRYAGIDRSKLPPLVPNDDIAGTVRPEVAAAIGIPAGTPVVAGMNDTNCSAIGAGAVRDFDGIIYIGTSLVMTCHVPFKKTDLFHMMFSMPSPLRNKYLLFAEQGVGGKALEFLLNLIYADDQFATGPAPDDAIMRADRAAASAPAGSGGAVFLPWLNGTIVPEENERARGAFFNLSLATTRPHLVRSVLEGLAFNSRWTRIAAERFIGCRFTSFRFAGGGARSDLWAQIHADILGVPILQIDDSDRATLRGAGLAALVNLGRIQIEDIPDLVPIRRVYEPNPSHRDIYDRLFKAFTRLFKRNRPIFNILNE